MTGISKRSQFFSGTVFQTSDVNKLAIQGTFASRSYDQKLAFTGFTVARIKIPTDFNIVSVLINSALIQVAGCWHGFFFKPVRFE